jgi:hypothetical protein
MDENPTNKAESRRKNAWLNAAAAVLVCLILLFSWLFAKHLFDYARERVNYYLYETYVSGLGSGFGRQQQRQPAPQAGLRGFAAPPQKQTESRAAYEFKTNLNPYQLGFYALIILACCLGLYSIASLKRDFP